MQRGGATPNPKDQRERTVVSEASPVSVSAQNSPASTTHFSSKHERAVSVFPAHQLPSGILCLRAGISPLPAAQVLSLGVLGEPLSLKSSWPCNYSNAPAMATPNKELQGHLDRAKRRSSLPGGALPVRSLASARFSAFRLLLPSLTATPAFSPPAPGS